MAYEHLTIEDQGHVVRCTIANPPRHTLVFPLIKELHQMLDDLDNSDQVRVLVLTGASDDYFMRHYEVQELVDAADNNLASGDSAPTGLPIKLHSFNRLCLRLENSRYVTIAALNASAGGGACEITLSCDFRLMKDGDFHYGLPETNIGILPGGGGTQRFARMLGTAKALDLILHGNVMNPAEALQLGLLHRVFPADSFEEDVAAFAENLARRAPVALASVKQSIRRGADLPMDQALLVEQQAFDQTMFTKDAAESMRAYLTADVQLGDMDYDFDRD
jgi:enoyl-CoA hydratase/carnithine racemase